MKPVRVCLLGAGEMGRLHARTVARRADQHGDCRLVAIVDRHPGRAESLARELEGEPAVPAVAWRAGLEQADVAIVAVPTSDHGPLACELLAQGLDLLVEKPLAGSVAEGERMLEQARRHERILQVGHVEWYNGAWREAAGRVGRLHTIEVERSSPVGDRGLDIDVVQDLMLHDLDWITRCVGDELVEIQATGRSGASGKLDEVVAWLRFGSGVRARLEASRMRNERRRAVRFEGSDGVAMADLMLRRPSATPDSVTEREQEQADARSGSDPLTAQWSDFMSAVRRREAPVNSGAVGLDALRLVDRVRTAVRSSSHGGSSP